MDRHAAAKHSRSLEIAAGISFGRLLSDSCYRPNAGHRNIHP